MANSLAADLQDLRMEDDATADPGTPVSGISEARCSNQNIDGRDSELVETVNSAIESCQTMYSEIQEYIAAVDALKAKNKTQTHVEYRSLRNDVRNELAFLKRLWSKNMSEKQVRNYIVSSNLVYYESLWDAAKRTSGLLSFRKYFFWNRREEGNRHKGLSLAKGGQTKGRSSALVDIVAQDGKEWVRVSSISEKRLLFDLAKMGWQNASDSDSDQDGDQTMADAPSHERKSWEDEDDEDQVDIVRSARDLARAARANPIRGRAPIVHMVLTRITSGVTKEIDDVLEKIRATGAIVQCANDIKPPPPLSEALPNLLIDHSRSLSEVLNIDCTILLALISDISHRPCAILDWYPSEVKAQIKDEEKEKLLPTHLYPAIDAHPMVCTQEAADQMMLIVNTLATDTETTRANIMLGQHEYTDKSPAELLQTWVALSDHSIPEGFRLPIRVVPSQPERYSSLPKVAEIIAKELGPLNVAIFFHGWVEGISTLSSNRARARQIDHAINTHGLEDGEAVPHIWLCGESRSLIAKQGRRK